jgi:hypothetical protein
LFPPAGFGDPIKIFETAAQPQIFDGTDLVTGVLLLCEQGDRPVVNNTQCGVLVNGMPIIHEPSDSVEFKAGPIAGTIAAIMCSDQDPAKDPGDNCNPPRIGNFAIIEAVKVTGVETIAWDPVAGQPGFAKRGTAVLNYTITSDTPKVPEPSSRWMLLTVLLLLGWLYYRPRRAVTP